VSAEKRQDTIIIFSEDMAARGAAQRPNGAAVGKICQFKLVLLGEICSTVKPGAHLRHNKINIMVIKLLLNSNPGYVPV
jgi:hypothetical protein